MRNNCFLVTGAHGCIGSWAIRKLLEMDQEVIAFDLDADPLRIVRLAHPRSLRKLRFVQGDINDLELLEGLLGRNAVTHVIHLAGLQTPECRAKPIRGAMTNVLGALTLFEAIKAHGDRVQCMVYASSGAVLGADEDYDQHPIPDGAPRIPGTLYGVFKLTNEECARIYWQEEGIRSVGLRPPGADRTVRSVAL